MKNTPKAVFAAGGDGTRLGNLNPNQAPKGSLLVAGAPLIKRQLDLLLESGVRDVLLSVNTKEHELLYRKLIENGELPKMNYQFNFHGPFSHPNEIFTYENVKKFIGENAFFFLQSDLYPKKDDIFVKMISEMAKNGGSVVVREQAREGDQKELVLKEGKLIKIQDTSRVPWRYGGVYLISPNELKSWFEMCENETNRTLGFFERCLKCPTASVFFLDNPLDDILNVNTPKDFQSLENHFSDF